MNKNELTKKIITALANAPAAALKRLAEQQTDPRDRDYIQRVAAAILSDKKTE